MKYSILSALVLFSSLFYNLNAQQISSDAYNKDYINEDFNKDSESFKVVTTTDNYFILDKGDYLLSRNNSESDYAIIAKNSIVSDFILKTSIRIGPSDNKKASLGIILKAQQNGKGAIIFEINKQGEYRIKQLIGNTYQPLSGSTKQKGWVKSKLVNGVDEKNFVEIRSENNLYDVYVNSEYLTTFFVPDFTNGSCGLIITPETKARVSYYHINVKGEKNIVENYTAEKPKNTNTSTQELDKKIRSLEENNTKLNELNAGIKELHSQEIEELNSKNSSLAAVTTQQEKEIKNLNTQISDLKNKTAKIVNLENENKKNIDSIDKLKIQNKEDLNAISNLKSKNNTLDTEIKELQNKLSTLKTKNNGLAEVSIEQEKEITSLSVSLEDLKNVSDNTIANKKKLDDKVSVLKRQIKKEKSVTSELITDLDNLNRSSKNTINELNNNIKELDTKISNLTKYNNTLKTDLSTEKSIHKKTKRGLSKSVKNKKTEIAELTAELNSAKELLEASKKTSASLKRCARDASKLNAELNVSNNELETLKKEQAKYDTETSILKNQIVNLNSRVEALTNNINTSNKENTVLKEKNNDLKELFIQKDFEINGVKPSEMVKEISNLPPAPTVLRGNKTIYSVQFGVYMHEQPKSSIRNIDNVWYNTTEQGTYVYCSGEFNSPQEAASHMNNLKSNGYTNAFVVTLTR